MKAQWVFGACSWLVAGLLVACQPAPKMGAECGSDLDCPVGTICVNEVCAPPYQPVACSRDGDCERGQICGSAGLCEDEPQVVYCNNNLDCPLDMYCNRVVSPGVCTPLQGRFCRADSQCSGMLRCSAAEQGGVGRCVECVDDADCVTRLCRADHTCEPGDPWFQDAGDAPRDAGIRDRRSEGRDAASTGGRDAAGSVEDPYCGAETQRCCTTASQQSSECDSPELTCLYGFPEANDAHCWRSCTPVACTTLEGESGVCRVAASWQGVCIGTMAMGCYGTYDCLYAYGEGECVAYSAYAAYCFAMNCNWEANCGDGYYCSARDNGLCLSTSMM